jgi:ferritin-like protein
MKETLKPHGCRVRMDARRVISLGQDLRRSLQRLRHDLAACRKCPLAGECTLRQEIDEQIDAAIAEVNAEWGMQGPFKSRP